MIIHIPFIYSTIHVPQFMYQHTWFPLVCFRSDALLLLVDDGVVINISVAVLSSWGKTREWCIVMKGKGGVLLWMRHGRNTETLEWSMVTSKQNRFDMCQSATLVVQFNVCCVPQNVLLNQSKREILIVGSKLNYCRIIASLM